MDALGEWCSGLTVSARQPGFLGVIDGARGGGQGELLDTLDKVCQSLGVAVLRTGARGGPYASVGLTVDLVRQVLQAGRRESAFQTTVPEVDADGFGVLRSPRASSLPEQLEAQLAAFEQAFAGTADVGKLSTLSDKYRRLRLVDSIARSLLELGQEKPLVVIVENLEDATGLLLTVLRHFLRLVWVRRKGKTCPRILVVATVQKTSQVETLLETSEWLDVQLDQLQQFQIDVRGYSRKDLRDTARLLLEEELPTSIGERVLRLSGGNPRHVRWLLSHIRESGGLRVAKNSVLQLSFAQLVQARFAALDERERALVTALSLTRRPLTPRDLTQLVATEDSPGGGEEAAVGDSGETCALLDGLVDSGWALARDSVSRGTVRRFEIADDQVGDEVLAGMKRAALSKAQIRVAGCLTEIQGGSQENLLISVRLLLEAGDDDRGLDTACRVAEALRDLSCTDEALEVIDEAASLGGSLKKAGRARLAVLRVALLEATGNFREALEACAEVDLLSDWSRPCTVVRHRRIRGDLYGRLGEVDQQIREYEAGVAAFVDDRLTFEDLNLLAALGQAYLDDGNLGASEECLEKCLDGLPEGTFAEHEARHVFALAFRLHVRRGQLERALEVGRRLVEHAADIDALEPQIDELQRVAKLEARLGHAKEAEENYYQALLLANQSGSRWLVAEALAAIGQHWQLSQNSSASLAYIEQAHGIFRDLGKQSEAFELRFTLLTLELEQGFFIRSKSSALAFAQGWLAHHGGEERDVLLSRVAALDVRERRKTLRRLEKSRAADGVAELSLQDLFLLARLLEESGQISEAYQLFREGLLREADPGGMGLRLEFYQAMGRIKALQGDARGALRLLEKGLSKGGDDADREHLVGVSLEVARVYRRSGELGRCFESLLRALRLTSQEPVPDVVVPVFLGLTEFFLEIGVLEAARELARSVVLLSQAEGLLRWEYCGRLQLGRIQRYLGHPEKSQAEYSRVHVLLRRLDLPLDMGYLKLELAWDRYYDQRFEESLNLAREGFEIARRLGAQELLGDLLLLLAVVKSDLHNPGKNFLRAGEFLEQSLTLAQTHKLPRLEWEALQTLACVYAERDKVDLSDEYVERSEEAFWRVFGELPEKLQGAGWVARATFGEAGRYVTLQPSEAIS